MNDNGPQRNLKVYHEREQLLRLMDTGVVGLTYRNESGCRASSSRRDSHEHIQLLKSLAIFVR